MFHIIIMEGEAKKEAFNADAFCVGVIVNRGQADESMFVRTGGDRKDIVFAHAFLGKIIETKVLPSG